MVDAPQLRDALSRAKDAKPRPGRGKDGKGISKFGFWNSKIISREDVGRILLNYLSTPLRPWREALDCSRPAVAGRAFARKGCEGELRDEGVKETLRP